MNKTQRNYRDCDDCKAPYAGKFKKVAHLQNSGLMIFVHKQKPALDERRTFKSKQEETFILHNVSDRELRRVDYITEMCQYRKKCFQCRTVVQKVRSLLDEMTDIQRNQVLGICQHCKRTNPLGKCRRCEYIVNKYLSNKVKQYEDRHDHFKSWLEKVNQLLRGILESQNVCKHNQYKDSSTVELDRLLQELKVPLEMRQPDISFFPAEPDSYGFMTQSKELLEELLTKLNTESLKKCSSEDSMFVSPSMTATSCVCKYIMDKKFESKSLTEVLPEVTPVTVQKLVSKTRTAGSGEKASLAGKELSKDKKLKDTPVKDIVKTQLSKEKTSGKENVLPVKEKIKTQSSNDKTPGKENVLPAKESKKKVREKTSKGKISIEKEPEEKTLKEKIPKDNRDTTKCSPEDAMLLKILKARKNEMNKKEKEKKPEKQKEFAKVESLPHLKKREVIKVHEQSSASVVECGNKDVNLSKMIKGAKVVSFDHRYFEPVTDKMPPLLFKIETDLPEPEIIKPAMVSNATTPTLDKESKTKGKHVESASGIIIYELSNRDYIEKGWTVLPTSKIMRRVNIYKMLPANPKYDWFERHKAEQIMFYDTGEKLAEIEGSGSGKWFYKNGRVALDYYNAQELGAGHRYVIYSSGEDISKGKTKPVTVLACFDFLGNGIVYNDYGDERLKYNQTEGMVIDEKIGPPGRWKWHDLNEPPNLQPVFIDSHVKNRGPCMNDLLEQYNDDKSEASAIVKEANDKMLAIEFENFVKEKAHKLLQKYKPFPIKMKTCKINDQFSLRIMDQANIYLLFRSSQVSLKLNLGLLLVNSEIVDTDTAEVSQVATPYDQYPAKSPSIAEIQHTLKNARRVGRSRIYKVIPVKRTSIPKRSVCI